MSRYFLELSYKGKAYAGFQIQDNALSVQEEVQKALKVYFRQSPELTGSSRTDTGVHALQNFFHFDWDGDIEEKSLYNLNALLPGDIAVRRIIRVKDEAHCRFDAIAREYKYYIYRSKDPFLQDRAYYYPYTLDLAALQEAAGVIPEYSDFTSFSKRNTQVKTFNCELTVSEWKQEPDTLIYTVKGNRFLRGMVRGLVGTMLQVGRGRKSIGEFRGIIEAKNCALADFSVPGHGLFLVEVEFDWSKIGFGS